MDNNSSNMSHSTPTAASSAFSFGTIGFNSTTNQASSSAVSSGHNFGTTNPNSTTHQPFSAAVSFGGFGTTNSKPSTGQAFGSAVSSGGFGTTNSKPSTGQTFSSAVSSGFSFGMPNTNSTTGQTTSSAIPAGLLGTANSNPTTGQTFGTAGSSGLFGTTNSNSNTSQSFGSAAPAGLFGTANSNSTSGQTFGAGNRPGFSGGPWNQNSSSGSTSNYNFGAPNFFPNIYQVSSSASTVTEIASHEPNVIKYSSGTSLEEYSLVNTWTVKGLNRMCDGTNIESAPLTHQDSSKWCMVLTKKANELHLCFLLKKSGTDKQLRAKLKADEVLPAFGIRRVFPDRWYNLKEGEKSEAWVVRRVDPFRQSYSDNEIVIQCEVCIQHTIQDEMPVADTAEPNTSIVKCLGEMFHKGAYADFELHTEGTIMPVHRGLLSIRSPFFADMLFADMLFADLLQPHTKEAKEGRMDVPDVKPEVLKQALLFMYTGGAPALKDMPWDLLKAAHKFQLRQLKRQCETHIAECLNVDNAAATAVEASVYSCDLLWDRAVVFIKNNLCDVIRTPGWAEARAAHPEAIQRIGEMLQ